MPNITVIIPVYNEERTISSIVEITRTWGGAREIIVVNDGSKDHTRQALRQFGRSIRVISSTKNQGKGYAMASGVRAATGDLLMFLDGDITGLSHNDLTAMAGPVKNGHADMVIGVARFWSVGSFEPYNDVSGQRVMWKSAVLPHLNALRLAGRGAEFLINDIHKTKRIVSVRLPHVFIFGKMEKQTVPTAMLDYLKEAREFLVTIVKIQSNDLTPQAKHVFRITQRYIKQALEYFQSS